MYVCMYEACPPVRNARDVTSRLKWVYKLDCATPTHKCPFQSKKNLADEGYFMTYGKSDQ